MAKNDRKGGNQPAYSNNSGLTSAAVFTNERKNGKTGENFTAVDVSLNQGYVDKDGNIQPTKSLTVNQALRAEHLLHNAIDEAMNIEGKAKRETRGKFTDREVAKGGGEIAR